MFIGRTDVEAETLILWPPEMQRADSFERTLMLGNIKGTTEDEMVGSQT